MSGPRTALVLIDFQERIVRNFAAENGRSAAEAALLAIDWARDRGDVVVHVQHLLVDGSDGGPGSNETRFLDGIEVRPGESVVTKHSRCAFEDTGLDGLLDRESVRRIVLAGVVTEGGIEATAHSALQRGYAVCVLTDAVAGHTESGHVDALERMREAGVELLAHESLTP